MDNYITLKKVVVTRTPIKRQLTVEEENTARESSVFDLSFDVVDWSEEITLDEDHQEQVIFWNKKESFRR